MTSCTSSSCTSGASSSRCAPVPPAPLLRHQAHLTNADPPTGKKGRLADFQQPPEATDRHTLADSRAFERQGRHDLCRIDRVRPSDSLCSPCEPHRADERERERQVRECRRRAQHGHDPARHAAARAARADTALFGQVRRLLPLGPPLGNCCSLAWFAAPRRLPDCADSPACALCASAGSTTLLTTSSRRRSALRATHKPTSGYGARLAVEARCGD